MDTKSRNEGDIAMEATMQITEWTCEHPEKFEDIHIKSSVCYYATYREAPEHWEWAVSYLAKKVTLDPKFIDYPKHLKWIRLCTDCHDAYLLHQNKGQRSSVPAPLLDNSDDDNAERQELIDRIESGESLYFCNGCNEFKDEGDLVSLRECPHCDETFDGNEGRNCPSCNRPFTRKLEGMGCPDCLDPDNLPEPATLEMLGVANA